MKPPTDVDIQKRMSLWGLLPHAGRSSPAVARGPPAIRGLVRVGSVWYNERMFDTTTETDDGARIEAWEQELIELEAVVSQTRARQVELLRRLDRHQPDTAAGMRTMGDWVSAHLDVSTQTANRLWQIARAHHDDLDDLMGSGSCGLDRAAVLVKLHAAGVTQAQLGDSAATGYSLGRLYGLLDRVRTPEHR